MRIALVRLGLGAVLGAAIACLDFAYYLSIAAAPQHIGVEAFLSLLAVWCPKGMLFVLILDAIERRRELDGWRLAAAVAAAVIAAVLAWQTFTILVLRDILGLRLFRDHMGQPVVWTGGVLYHAWLLLFFGGMAAAVEASLRWRARVFSALRAAELERAASQQRLAEGNLASLRARVDPEQLYRTFTRLEREYETDAAAADRMLDELIIFLRQRGGTA